MMLSPECQTGRAEDTLQNAALIFADGPAGFNAGPHGSDRTDWRVHVGEWRRDAAFAYLLKQPKVRCVPWFSLGKGRVR